MKVWVAIISAALLLFAVNSCKGKVNPFPVVDAQFERVAVHQFG